MAANILVIISSHVTDLIGSLGYGGLTLLMALESCNLPIPSEVIQPFGGYLVSTGRLTFGGAVLAGTVGGTIGSLASYYLGRYAIDSRMFFWVSQTKRHWLTAWFNRYGESTVFFGRLIPIVRTFISLPAGAGKMNVIRFIGFTFGGSLIWSILLTYLGYILGQNWDMLKGYFHKIDIVVALAVIALSMLYYLHRYLLSKIGDTKRR